MIDFDSRPCYTNFIQDIIQQYLFDRSTDGNTTISTAIVADIAISNAYDEMEVYEKSGTSYHYKHWLGEHSSGVVALNMNSSRTRVLLGLYVHAFHAMSKNSKSLQTRDQPSLMVALRAMASSLPSTTKSNSTASTMKQPQPYYKWLAKHYDKLSRRHDQHHPNSNYDMIAPHSPYYIM